MGRLNALLAVALLLAGCALAVGGDDMSRDRRAARNRSMQRGSGGSASAWDIVVDCRDATFSGSEQATWPLRRGNATLTVDPDYKPTNLGATINGHTAVTVGPTATIDGGRLASGVADGLGTGLAGFAVEITARPDNINGNANGHDPTGSDREYYLYFNNDSGLSTDHTVIAHLANNGGVYEEKGIYIAGAWTIFSNETAPVDNGLLCETWIADPSGDLHLVRNGALVATGAWTPSTLALRDMTLFASPGEFEAPDLLPGTPFRGGFAQVRARGRTMSVAEAIAEQAYSMATFGVSASTWRPTTSTETFTAWWDSHGLQIRAASTLELNAWLNHTGTNHLVQGTATRYPSLTRVAGLLGSLFDGANDRLAGSQLGTYVSAGSYEALFAFSTPGATQTSSTPNALGQIWCDDAGRVYIALRKNGDNTDLVVGHYDGTGASNTLAGCIVFPSITLDALHVVHAWYDGTHLHARLDNGAEATPVARGNIAAVTANMFIGGYSDATSFNGSIIAAGLSNAALSSGDRASLRTFVSYRLNGHTL
jgi:hypothetical protein